MQKGVNGNEWGEGGKESHTNPLHGPKGLEKTNTGSIK